MTGQAPTRRNLLRGRLTDRAGPAPSDEAHIASLLVQARKADLGAIAERITELPGAEVHAHDPRGKLLVTLETESEAQIVGRLTQIQQLDGVITAALVYHQVDGPGPAPEG